MLGRLARHQMMLSTSASLLIISLVVVLVINLTRSMTTVPVGAGSLTVTPHGRHAYAPNQKSNNVTVIESSSTG